jgi:hypothetical protein
LRQLIRIHHCEASSFEWSGTPAGLLLTRRNRNGFCDNLENQMLKTAQSNSGEFVRIADVANAGNAFAIGDEREDGKEIAVHRADRAEFAVDPDQTAGLAARRPG